jgi:hypothetical protein
MISQPGIIELEIGGVRRRLCLRNGEIERFEIQYAPFGIFTLFDQLFGRGDAPQVRHVRDILALGLVGGGMTDRAADETIAALDPSHNMGLRLAAQMLLGRTFLSVDAEKKSRAGGSRKRKPKAPGDMTPAPESATSAD